MKSQEQELQKVMQDFSDMIDRMPDDTPDDEQKPTQEQIEQEKANHALDGFPDRHKRDLALYGEEWNAAYKTATELAESGGIIVTYGKRGTGKTQIAYEIAKNARFPKTHYPPVFKDGFHWQPLVRPCIYVKAMDIFLELKHTFSKHSETTEKQVIDRLIGAAFLVIDEAHVRGETKFEDDKITHIIDKRYDAMMPTMLITNLEKHEFAAQLSPSVKNRIQEIGGGIECNWQSYRKQTIPTK